jgi:hypothetical protein
MRSARAARAPCYDKAMNGQPDRPFAGAHAGARAAATASRDATGTFFVKTTKTTT